MNCSQHVHMNCSQYLDLEEALITVVMDFYEIANECTVKDIFEIWHKISR